MRKLRGKINFEHPLSPLSEISTILSPTPPTFFNPRRYWCTVEVTAYVSGWLSHSGRPLYCKSKRLSLVVIPVNLSDMRSLEFTVRRILIKLFNTYDCAMIIDSCMSLFGLSVSELTGQRVHRFLFKFNMLDNIMGVPAVV